MADKKKDLKKSPAKKNKGLPVNDLKLPKNKSDKVTGGGCGCTGMGQDPVTSRTKKTMKVKF